MITRILSRGLAPLALAIAAFSTAPALADAGHGGTPVGQPGKASAASRTVEVAMYDSYYEPETITVKPGETVRFVVMNRGGLVHEFNIGTAATHASHQAEMAMMVEHGVIEADRINRDMMNMDMGGGQTMKHDDPNSLLLEPGATAEVVWSFPTDRSVDIDFACNVPGHYEAGMQGDIEISG